MAQTWPTRPVKLIVPFAAGGSTDVLARFIAQGLGAVYGQAVVVENRPGAGGNLGTDLIAKAAPDGYTLAMSTSGPLANNKFLYQNMPYDPQTALAPVILVGDIPLVLAVHPGLPASNLKQYLELARQDPTRAIVAHPGKGTLGHLAIELLSATTNTQLLSVPYKGDSPAITDAIAGTVPAICAPVTGLLPHLRSGKLRGLAITAPKRLAQLPEIPTAAEQGFSLEASVWFGIVGPARLPPAVIETLNRDIQRLLDSSEGQTRLTQFAAQAGGGSAAQMAQLMRTEALKWQRIIQSSGVTLD